MIFFENDSVYENYIDTSWHLLKIQSQENILGEISVS